MNNLVWFDKEGNYLNINYNQNTEKYEGDLMFSENSSDTHKTIGLYLFENIPAFEYENDGNLFLKKFQLFNEYGININSSNGYATQSITKIEATNNDPQVFSKWLYGENFESKFPKGTKLRFNDSVLEFTSVDITYTVVDTRKNGVLILSNTNNNTFNSLYSGVIGLTSTYYNKTVSALNTIAVHNYINSAFENNLSLWSEPNFYNSYFIGRKLSLVNTKNNDGVYTVKSNTLYDKVYASYQLPTNVYATGSNLIVELIVNKGQPIIYSGYLSILERRIEFTNIPSVFRSGVQFLISDSTLNRVTITVDSVPSFLSTNTVTFYSTQSQVMWNNRLYECINAYTQSLTSSITPDNITYWSATPSYIPVVETLTPELHLYTDVYLTSNKFYYNIGWSYSNDATLYNAYKTIKSDFNAFDINVTYNSNILSSDLIYSSGYAIVNYYANAVGSTNSIGINTSMYENIIEVEEETITENCKNISENFYYNIVFTDLDEFGLIIKINSVTYQQEIEWVYNGISVDLTRTIDTTIRAWLNKNYLSLLQLGILASVSYVGYGLNFYVNSITLQTQYPNVPLKFEVLVGSEAAYYIEGDDVQINELGGLLSLTINGKIYEQATTFTSPQVADIPTTINNWISNNSVLLNGYGVYATASAKLLSLYTKSQKVDVNISNVSIGKSLNSPNIQYEIFRKRRGSIGSIIASNEIYLSSTASVDFEESGFATGMITTINNTVYPYDNQDYNLLYVDPQQLILSYQGPFWGTTASIEQLSAYIDIAFSDGFGSTSSGITSSSYMVNSFDFSSYAGTLGFCDMIYVQKSNSIYVLSDNSLIKFDSINGRYSNVIYLKGASASTSGYVNKMRYNPLNDNIYINARNYSYVVYAPTNQIVSVTTSIYSDVVVNYNSGYTYLSGATLSNVWVYGLTNSLVGTISTPSTIDRMVYNSGDNIVMAICSNSVIVSMSDSITVSNTYSIPGSGAANAIFYTPVNNTTYVFGDRLTLIKGTSSYLSSLSGKQFNNLIYDNFTGNICVSQVTASTAYFVSLDTTTSSNIIYSITSSNYGYLALSQYDGYIYMSNVATSSIVVIDASNGHATHSEVLPYLSGAIIYNQDRRTIWTIESGNSNIVEISSVPLLNLSASTYSLPSNYGIYGALSPDYVAKTDMWLQTRDYIRKPRYNYSDIDSKQVSLYYKWVDDSTPEMFIYDFSGEQLETGTSYSYIGPKPLTLIALNRNPNMDITKIERPEFQQTIFESVSYTLDYIDSSTNISFTPQPIELFLGFNSVNEGPLSSTLKLYFREGLGMTISSTSLNGQVVTFRYITDEKNGDYGVISLSSQSVDLFTNGNILKVGQHISIYFTDNTNINNSYISFNNGKVFKIRNVYTRSIVVDFLDDVIVDEATVVNNYPTTNVTTYLSINIVVVDKEIASFNVFGQTEIEDIRYNIQLSNQGKNITANDVYIFKSYDIEEEGVDWIFLNSKRKEMLMVKNDIFPYVGSYKAIVNAINYFGYNDLELYEYYRNININSPMFDKLFKVEIPDIFDNSVPGFTVNDFLKNTMPNKDYETTNLFNLTYNITDREGNNVLLYSLSEVIVKLQGLKNWLESNVIPITHRILDITGRADTVGNNTIVHRNYASKLFDINQTMTPVDFKVNEAYLMPINSGSSVYTVVVDFNVADSSVPDYFTLKIRTYMTYPEWEPFVTYQNGDIVNYYNKIYVSEINNNKINDPRQFDYAPKWSMTIDYHIGEIVNYNNSIYEFQGTQSLFSLSQSITSPLVDTTHWLDITKWKQIDYSPVQTLNEYRTSTQSYIFTVDTSIDPFVSIEVVSDNGYGQIFTSKKNYEIRGISNRSTVVLNIDPIGPFTPIPFI